MKSDRPQPLIPVFRLVLIQATTAIVGFALLFSVCVQGVLRYHLSQIEPQELAQLDAYQEHIRQQQQVYDGEEMQALLETVCWELECSLDPLAISVDTKRDLYIERLKATVTIDLLQIPIFLDILRSHPQQWNLQGVEVHAYTNDTPSKMQVRLWRTVTPENIVTPSWVQQLGWGDLEQEMLSTLYRSWLTRKWVEQRHRESEQSKTDWYRLTLGLNKVLWGLEREKGSMVYTPAEGMEYMSLAK